MALPGPSCVRRNQGATNLARLYQRSGPRRARGGRGGRAGWSGWPRPGTIAVFVYANITEQARIARAVADIAILSSEISTFESMNERLPNNLAEIGRSTLLDPWGRPYEYLSFAVGPLGLQRKDLALVPINTDYDLYSKGKNGVSQPPLTASASLDDVVRANDGQFIGLASNY